MVLALVVNVEGLIKYSNVFEGNTTDCNTLPSIIDNLRKQTSDDKRAVVVIDAGIATEENLELIKSKGYDYVCVSLSRSKIIKVKSTGKQAKERAMKSRFEGRLTDEHNKIQASLDKKTRGKAT